MTTSTVSCLIGTALRPRITFTDRDTGQKVDPDVVMLIFKPDSASGNPTNYTWNKTGSQDPNINHESLGVFSAKINCNVAGDWTGLWRSEGQGQATEDFTITVRPHSLYVP